MSQRPSPFTPRGGTPAARSPTPAAGTSPPSTAPTQIPSRPPQLAGGHELSDTPRGLPGELVEIPVTTTKTTRTTQQGCLCPGCGHKILPKLYATTESERYYLCGDCKHRFAVSKDLPRRVRKLGRANKHHR